MSASSSSAGGGHPTPLPPPVRGSTPIPSGPFPGGSGALNTMGGGGPSGGGGGTGMGGAPGGGRCRIFVNKSHGIFVRCTMTELLY